MHVPSPSDYYPFDSDANTVFKHDQINVYVNCQFLTLYFRLHIADGLDTVAVVVSPELQAGLDAGSLNVALLADSRLV